MTTTQTEDIFARGAQWVPILLFHLGLYLQDPEAGWAVLEPGNPLFDIVPIDVLAAVLIVFDSLAVMGEVTPDDLEGLMREFGSALAGTTTDNQQGSDQ